MSTDGHPDTLASFILGAATAYPDAEAVVLAGDRVTYAGLVSGATGWARTLIALGVTTGEHVGILLTNGTEFMQVMFGVALAGAVPVPLNVRYRGQELAATVADADLVTIVTSGGIDPQLSLVDRLNEAFPDLPSARDPESLTLQLAPALRKIVLAAGSAAPGFLPRDRVAASADAVTARAVEGRWRSARSDDTALILYTSGSTSHPKGCLLSHTAVLAQGRLMAARYAMNARDRIWSPVPMFHVGGISPFVAIASVGGTLLSIHKFEAGPGLAMLEGERATIAYVLFQTIISDLLHHADFQQRKLTSVRLMISNLALQPAWIRDLLSAQIPGAVQIGTYGLTETVGAACTHAPDDPAGDRLQRLGRPLPGVEVRIVDEDDRDVSTGTIGEVLLRGPTVCKGYYRALEKTASALRGGWLHTGDRGSLDARGSVMFHGRLKDVLKVGGEGVGALEVESVVGAHPAVKGCAVVGMPDPRLVEVPVVFVELRPGACATPDEIIAFCVGKLASFKVPRRAYLVTEWPMNATKIDKPALSRRLVPAPLV
jgi:acyl-CoA synthetase (AMP-forming)/AMP-acid ligase II